MKQIILTISCYALLLGLWSAGSWAQEDPAAIRAAARAEAQQRYQANRRVHADDDDVLIKPGLIASRKDRRVVVDAVATGLPASDPVEFFLIPEQSGKDYEALAVAFAKPSDIDQALRFIGMEPGRPVDYAAMTYWPKGPRVLMRFRWGEGEAENQRAERFVLDTRTKRHLPLTGFVYAGSTWQTNPQTGQRVFAADVSDSMSIASNYNEPTTLLDVPRRAPQGDVYSYYKPNPELQLPAGKPIQVIFEPEPRRLPRVVDLNLHLGPGKDGAPTALNELVVDLADASDKALVHDGKVTEALVAFGDLVHAEHDPYVTLHIDGRVPLGLVRQFNKLMLAAEGERGIRIEAPPAGQLYPQAFVPNPKWRDRKTRLFTAFELFIEPADNDDYAARLLETHDRFTAEQPPTMTKAEHQITDGAELARLIRQADPIGRRAIVVIADDRAPYKRLMDLLSPVLPNNPHVYVFPLDRP